MSEGKRSKTFHSFFTRRGSFFCFALVRRSLLPHQTPRVRQPPKKKKKDTVYPVCPFSPVLLLPSLVEEKIKNKVIRMIPRITPSIVVLVALSVILSAYVAHGETEAIGKARATLAVSCDPNNGDNAACRGTSDERLSRKSEIEAATETTTTSTTTAEAETAAPTIELVRGGASHGLCGCESFHARYAGYLADIATRRGYPYTEEAPRKRYSTGLDVTCNSCTTVGATACRCEYSLTDSGLASIDLDVSAKVGVDDMGSATFIGNPWVNRRSSDHHNDESGNTGEECTAETATEITSLLRSLLDAVVSPLERGDDDDDNGEEEMIAYAYPPVTDDGGMRDLAAERDLYAAEQSAAMRELHVIGLSGPISRIGTGTEANALFSGDGVSAAPGCACSPYGELLVYSANPALRLCGKYRYRIHPRWLIEPFTIGEKAAIEGETPEADSLATLEDYTERLINSIDVCEDDMTYTWNTTVDVVKNADGKSMERVTWTFVDSKCNLPHLVTHHALIQDTTSPVVQLKNKMSPADYVQPCGPQSEGFRMLREVLEDVDPSTSMVTVSDDMSDPEHIRLTTSGVLNSTDLGLYHHTWTAQDAYGNEGNFTTTYQFADRQRRINTNLGLCVWPPGTRGRSTVEFAIADVPKLVETLITRSMCDPDLHPAAKLTAHIVSCDYVGPDPKTAAAFRRGGLDPKALCRYDAQTGLLHVAYMSNTDYTDLEVGVQLRDYYGTVGQKFVYEEGTDMGDPALGGYKFSIRVPRTYSAQCPISARRGELHIQVRADFYRGYALVGPNIEIVSAPMPRVSQYAVQFGLSPDVIY